jgi:hypothetical protein
MQFEVNTSELFESEENRFNDYSYGLAIKNQGTFRRIDCGPDKRLDISIASGF